MVLDRYILRLWATPFLGFLFIVTGVLLLGRVLKLLGLFADKGIDWGIMVTMLMSILPYFLVITVPIAFFFAMQSMLLKLYQGSEMDALRASGVSYVRLLRPIIAVAILLWVCLTVTSLYWMPEGQKSFQQLFIAVQKAKPAPGFDPQRFNHEMEDFTVYVEGEDDEGNLLGFMLEDRRSTVPVLYVSEWAELKKSGAYLNLLLYNGTRLEGAMDNLRTLSFDQYQVSVEIGGSGILKLSNWRSRVFEMNANELWEALEKGGRLDAVVEFNRRLVLPTSILILFFLCLPVSAAPKRSGKAGSYIAGTALLLLIYNVQIVLHQQANSGALPWWSMWVGQITILGLALWMFRRVSQDQLPLAVAGIEQFVVELRQRVIGYVRRRSDVSG